MAGVTRNSLKGYTFQQYILTLFVAKMDTEHSISKIESEAPFTKQFDDIYLYTTSGDEYRIQVKNYPGTKLSDLEISTDVVVIKNNRNIFDPNDNNILVINTDQIETNTFFMGLPAVIINGITILPLTESMVTDCLDSMYQHETRELQIIQKTYEYTSSSKFLMCFEDLPPVICLSSCLIQDTVLLREVPENFPNGITYYVGKPGVGKSHFVEEIKAAYPEAIIYRFWIDAHDSDLSTRLQYDVFIRELGLRTFHSPRSFTIEQLIEKITDDNRIVIIDGLDHVENYNPHELNKFVCFIERLGIAKIKTVVLSRPLKEPVSWDKTEIINWNLDETRLYLAVAHGIEDYSVQKRVFDLANGYPIITSFLANHYKKYNALNIDEPIVDLNAYYDSLLNNVSTKSLMCIFAANTSFFTYKELSTLIGDSGLYDTLVEFIQSYPYLFQIVQNRISLVHDSLNTYLRNILHSYPRQIEVIYDNVKASLISGCAEYMARFSSFHFEESFIDTILTKYSDFSAFTSLLSKTLDFNSISSFYQQLQTALEKREGVLSCYQYYAFALIFQAATRNDLIGNDGLVYQILLYLNKHFNIEDQIYSSGVIWHLYLACQKREDLTKLFFANSLYGEDQLYTLYEAINKEIEFFDQAEKPFEVEDIFISLRSNQIIDIEKSDLLIDYLATIWVEARTNAPLYDKFSKFIDTGNNLDLYEDLINTGLHDRWIKRAINGAEHRLHELGCFGAENKYRKNSLMGVIRETAPKGSFYVVSEVQSYLRLANHDAKEVDIFSINYVWTMYYQRKDYSVYTIDKALILFEEFGFVNEDNSIELITRLQNQSEKGIRHLLASFINLKGPACVKRLIDSGAFNNIQEDLDIFDLSSENIGCLSSSIIRTRLYEILWYCRYSKTVDAAEIGNALLSSYSSDILRFLRQNQISVNEVRSEAIEQMLSEKGVDYTLAEKEEEKEYVPFSGGYIHEEDFEYIKNYGIPADECAKYADGWYSCLPYVDLFELFPSDYLKHEYLHLLHQSMFSRVIDKEYIGNWYNLIGNIPEYLRTCHVEVNWATLFNAFIAFLDVSLIAHS